MALNESYVDIVHTNLSQPLPCTGYIVVSLVIVPFALIVFLLCIRFCCFCDRLSDCLLRRRPRHHAYNRLGLSATATAQRPFLDDSDDDDIELSIVASPRNSSIQTTSTATASTSAVSPTPSRLVSTSPSSSTAFPVIPTSRSSIGSPLKNKRLYAKGVFF